MSTTDSGTTGESIEAATDLVRESIESSEDHSVDEHFDEDDVESSLESMAEFGLPAEEMARSYLNNTFGSDTRPEGPRSGTSRSGEDDELVDITSQDALRGAVDDQSDTDGAFIASVFRVARLLEPVHESMQQRLLAATPNGRMPIAVWTGCNTTFEEGETYHVTGVKVDYDAETERCWLGLNEAATVTESPSESELADQYDQAVPVEFEVPDYDKKVSGIFADIAGGLIQRCTAQVEGHNGEERECGRVLDDGTCEEHGDVEGRFDLRIKARLEDGEQSHRVYASDAETVEAITGGKMTLEGAIETAQETMNRSVIEKQLEGFLLGLPATLEVQRYSGSGFGITDWEFQVGGDEEAANATADRLRSQVIALSEDDEASETPALPEDGGDVAAAD